MIDLKPKMTVMSFDPAGNFDAQLDWDRRHGIHADVYLDVDKAPGKKCARCWKTCLDTDQHQWADACGRCNTVMDQLFDEDPEKIRAL